MKIIIKPIGAIIIVAFLGFLVMMAIRSDSSKSATSATAPTAAGAVTPPPDAAPDPANLLKPTGDTTNWVLLASDGGDASLSTAPGNVLVATIKKSAAEDYKIALYQENLKIPDGAKVTIKFKARAVPTQSIKVWADTGSSTIWPGWGQTETYATDWNDYSFTFVATNPDNKSIHAPVFALGKATGSLYLKDVVVKIQ